MIDIRPFEPDDLNALDVQDRHSRIYRLVDEYPGLVSAMQRWGYTAWSPFGVPLAACGILENHVAWALLAKDLRRQMVPIVRAIRHVMAEYHAKYGELYADIDPEFPQAVRWARALGFTPGANHWSYAGCATSTIPSKL